jgi:hypothetical protein
VSGAQEEQDVSAVVRFEAGGYRYLRGVFQYSAGVAAESGFRIERAWLSQLLPLADGFAAIESHLKSRGRPLTALCACELRSPAPFTEDGFEEFNRLYVGTLQRWGIYRDGENPIARTNVCPVLEPPPVPVLSAFSYTMKSGDGSGDTFVIAGGGEAPEGKPNYRDYIVRRGDTSFSGLREKVSYVVKEMERRLSELGYSWRDAIHTQAYSSHDIGPLLREEILHRGTAPRGLTWHYCRPPMVELEYEMDARRTACDIAL